MENKSDCWGKPGMALSNVSWVAFCNGLCSGWVKSIIFSNFSDTKAWLCVAISRKRSILWPKIWALFLAQFQHGLNEKSVISISFRMVKSTCQSAKPLLAVLDESCFFFVNLWTKIQDFQCHTRWFRVFPDLVLCMLCDFFKSIFVISFELIDGILNMNVTWIVQNGVIRKYVTHVMCVT